MALKVFISGTYSGNVLEEGTFLISFENPSSGKAFFDGDKCTITFYYDNGLGSSMSTTING